MLDFEIEDKGWKGAVELALRLDPSMAGRLNSYYHMVRSGKAEQIKRVFDEFYGKLVSAAEDHNKRYDEAEAKFSAGNISIDEFVRCCYAVYKDSLVSFAEFGFVDGVITEQEVPKILEDHSKLLREYGYDVPSFLKAIEPKTKPSNGMQGVCNSNCDADIEKLLKNPELRNLFEIYACTKEAQDMYHILACDLQDPIMWKVRNRITDFLCSKGVLPPGKVLGCVVAEKYREYAGEVW